jgi:hypothetical protein
MKSRCPTSLHLTPGVQAPITSRTVWYCAPVLLVIPGTQQRLPVQERRRHGESDASYQTIKRERKTNQTFQQTVRNSINWLRVQNQEIASSCPEELRQSADPILRGVLNRIHGAKWVSSSTDPSPRSHVCYVSIAE